MQFDSQNTWNKQTFFFFFPSLKIRNFENYCPSAVSLFRSGRKPQQTLLPKPSNNSTSEWQLEIVYQGRKLLSFYSSTVRLVSCLRLDLVLIKGIRWQFRICSQIGCPQNGFWVRSWKYTLSFTIPFSKRLLLIFSSGTSIYIKCYWFLFVSSPLSNLEPFIISQQFYFI